MYHEDTVIMLLAMYIFNTDEVEAEREDNEGRGAVDLGVWQETGM